MLAELRSGQGRTWTAGEGWQIFCFQNLDPSRLSSFDFDINIINYQSYISIDCLIFWGDINMCIYSISISVHVYLTHELIPSCSPHLL